MKKIFVLILIFISCSSNQVQKNSIRSQKGFVLNADATFKGGELNLSNKEQLIAVGGEILQTIQRKGEFPLYKISIAREDVKEVWISLTGPIPTEGYKKGDKIIVAGYPVSVEELKQNLRDIIKCNSLVLGIYSEFM